jgi:hypothetical protein
MGVLAILKETRLTHTYMCPICRSSIPLDDINVATDIALCRACGNTSPFSLISGTAEVPLETLSRPPRGVRIEKEFLKPTVITYRRLSPALLFLIPFTALWSGISMFGIYGTQIRKGEFDLSQSLFGIPFLIGTIVLLSVIAFLLFGKWKITLEKGAGRVFLGVGPVGWTRKFSYNRDSYVTLRATNVRVNEIPQKGILVRTGTQDFVFGAMLKVPVKMFIAAAITREAKGG